VYLYYITEFIGDMPVLLFINMEVLGSDWMTEQRENWHLGKN